MRRYVLACMCLVLAISIAGCTKTQTGQSKVPSSQDTKVQEPVTSETPQQAGAESPSAPAADKPKDDSPLPPPADQPPADMAAAPTEDDTKPKTEPQPPVPLPYAGLIGELKEEPADEMYQQTEASLAQNPQDPMARLQLAGFLNAVGGEFANRGNKEKALEAHQAAFDQTQKIQLVSPDATQAPPDAMVVLNVAYVQHNIGDGFAESGNQERSLEVYQAALDTTKALPEDQSQLPKPAKEALAAISFDGARALAVAGKLEDAKTALQKAVDAGFKDVQKLRADAELAALQTLPDFQQLVDGWVKAIE